MLPAGRAKRAGCPPSSSVYFLVQQDPGCSSCTCIWREGYLIKGESVYIQVNFYNLGRRVALHNFHSLGSGFTIPSRHAQGRHPINWYASFGWIPPRIIFPQHLSHIQKPWHIHVQYMQGLRCFLWGGPLWRSVLVWGGGASQVPPFETWKCTGIVQSSSPLDRCLSSFLPPHI